ncbi:MAG TPA: murein biosynthesis integral membrane protein MurJ [Candidatus Pacearchaeota archaeon]|mgnify:CR=1 FL=1|nr:murein biosynthesis integral membrane protein MurJ [Candidatus Pacearchaeota archaeon]
MKFFDFFKTEQNTIGKATVVIAVFVVFSKILGLIRDRLLASTFGASAELDIYFASFRIPDLIYSIVLAGGVLVSLLPLFSDYFQKNKEESWKLINSVINIFSLILIVIAIFIFIFTSTIVKILLPEIDPMFLNTAVNLTRILFMSVFFFGLSSIFSTVLNYFNRFLIYSIAPVLYTLSIVLSILFLSSIFGIYAPAIGVVVGSFLHFFIQFYVSLKYGYKYKFVLDFKFKGIKDFFKLLFPRIISAAASQLNLTMITIIAGTIAVGSITYFNLADNLRFLPIGLIGISFATAVFPSLSKSITDKNMLEFCTNLRRVLQDILYLALPISILTFVMRDLIVNIIYGVGQFSGEAVSVTSACLGIFALSLIFQCLEPTILRAFFSIKDSKTPAIISIIFLFINLTLSLGFVYLLQVNENLNAMLLSLFNLNNPEHALLLGLVLAYNISLVIDFVLLFVFLRKKIEDFEVKKIQGFLLKIFFSSVIMTVIALFIINLFNNLNGFWMNLFEFIAVTIISFIVYFILTYILKTEEARKLGQFLGIPLTKL